LEGGKLPLEVGDDFGPGQGITLRFMQKGGFGLRDIDSLRYSFVRGGDGG
jgi:hypothetical protein